MKPLLLAAAALLCAACQAVSAAPPATPAAPAFPKPAGLHVVLEAQAKGDQIYACTAATAGAFEWKLEGPDAELSDPQGKPLGKHYAGPTWESVDGSKVVGQLKEKMDAPDPEAVPWLVLEAKSNAGAGVLAAVKVVQRVETHGGKAPRDGCDAGHAGAKVRVPYRARYDFYAP